MFLLPRFKVCIVFVSFFFVKSITWSICPKSKISAKLRRQESIPWIIHDFLFILFHDEIELVRKMIKILRKRRRDTTPDRRATTPHKNQRTINTYFERNLENSISHYYDLCFIWVFLFCHLIILILYISIAYVSI